VVFITKKGHDLSKRGKNVAMLKKGRGGKKGETPKKRQKDHPD